MKHRMPLMIFLFSLMMTWVCFSVRPGYESKPRVSRMLLVIGGVSGAAALVSGAWFVIGKARERREKNDR